MNIDLGDAPLGTPPTEEEKIQIRQALGVNPVIATIDSTPIVYTQSDGLILCDDDAAGEEISLLLPSAADVGYGSILQIKKKGTTANIVLLPDGSETIDGGTNATLTVQNECLTILSDGVNWNIA